MSTSRVARSSFSSQIDDLAKVDIDTVIANSDKTFDGWQVRVQLLRPHHSSDKPVLYAVNGTAANYLSKSTSTSITTMTKTREPLGPPAIRR